jgi:hypothetical protein
MLRINKVETDSFTGHLTVHVQVVEKVSENNSILGSTETHGIAAMALQDKFGGDPKVWLTKIHEGAVQRHQSRKITATAVQALKGITLFDEETTNGTHPASARTEVLGHADQDSTHQPA